MNSERDSILVPLQTEGTAPPFFYAHGRLGDVQPFKAIARRMDPVQPLYGLQAIGMQPGCEPDRRIETMAARYVDVVRQVQPSGPYYLGGHCYGGLVAYEMARQLEALGETTALLAIIEGATPPDYFQDQSLFHPQRLEQILQSVPHSARCYKEFGGLRVGYRIQKKLGLGPQSNSAQNGIDGRSMGADELSDVDARLEELRQMMQFRHTFFNAPPPDVQLRLREINLRAMDEYVYRPYGGTVTLFRARLMHFATILSWTDPQCGWGSLARGGVSIRYIDGTHGGCLREPYVGELISQLQKALREAREAYRQEQ
jgi:thioesterase domain-containing protein